jgi:flavodoxin
MKTLIVYYSRSGNTRKVAEELAQELKADVEQLIDHKNRHGILGWLGAGWSAAKKLGTVITPAKFDPSGYDLVIVGTPLWAFGGISPAVRTYLNQTKGKIRKIAFFLTKGGTPGEKAFTQLTEVSALTPIATLEITAKELKQVISLQKFRDFLAALKTI